MLRHYQPNYFAILFIPRSGSHLLRSALAAHPDIASISREVDTNQYIADNRNLYPPVDKLTGHKLSAVHLHTRDRFHMVACPAIATYRNNKLSQHISNILGTRDGFFSVSRRDYDEVIFGGQERPIEHRNYKDKKFRLDIDNALLYIRTYQKTEARVRQLFPDTLWLEYGEIAYGDGFRKAQEYLGLRVIELPKLLKKQSKGTNLEYITNLDEVLQSPLAGWV
jgi:hypothetical protein